MSTMVVKMLITSWGLRRPTPVLIYMIMPGMVKHQVMRSKTRDTSSSVSLLLGLIFTKPWLTWLHPSQKQTILLTLTDNVQVAC